MSTEEKYILQILSDFIFERPTDEPTNSLDWKALYDIASNHEIGGIVFSQCKSFLPDIVFGAFQSANSATMYYYSKRNTIRSSVIEALTSKNIPHFTIKGDVIANYYPIPALRTSGDIDLVVHSEDRDAVFDMLVDMDFIPSDIKDENEWKLEKNKVELELHNTLAYKKSFLSPKQYEFFDSCWNYVSDNVLDINFHFIFLIIHMYKHFKATGLGIRLFLDIAVMSKNPKNLDFDWIEKKLVETDLIDFAMTTFAINKRWFGVDIPFGSLEISDELFNSSTEFIFNNGVFGMQNSETISNLAVNSMLSGTSKFALLKEQFFPSYKRLVTDPRYSWIEGKRYLVPAAWIKKYSSAIKNNKVKSSCKNIAKQNVSKEDFEERVTFLHNWGINMDHNKKKK